MNVHSFRLSTTDNNNNTEGKVDLSIDGRTATLVPLIPLKYSAVYTVKITTEVKDLNGNPLANDEKWSFVTITIPPKSGGGSAGAGGSSPPLDQVP
jgi:Bacterial Ig-like domain